ncbi:MAG: VOC family protein [Pseudomonadota bacterium]
MSIAIMLAALIATGCGPDSDQPPVVIGISYVGVSVADLGSATEFYADSAGLTVVESIPLQQSLALDRLVGREGVAANTTLLRSTNAQLRLMEFTDRSVSSLATAEVPVYGPGIAHVCFQAATETETFQKFRANGATPQGAEELIRLNPRNPVWYAYLRDPDRIMFEVEHVDVAELDLPEPPEHDRRIRHVSIATPDFNRTVRFYKQLLSNPKPRKIGSWFGGVSGATVDQVAGVEGAKLAMAWFQVGNLELEVIEYKSHPTALPLQPRAVDALGYNMIVFDVVDLDSAKSMLEAAGGLIVSDIESHATDRIFFGRDPDGNLLGFRLGDDASPYSSRNFARPEG